MISIEEELAWVVFKILMFGLSCIKWYLLKLERQTIFLTWPPLPLALPSIWRQSREVYSNVLFPSAFLWKNLVDCSWCYKILIIFLHFLSQISSPTWVDTWLNMPMGTIFKDDFLTSCLEVAPETSSEYLQFILASMNVSIVVITPHFWECLKYRTFEKETYKCSHHAREG